MLSVWEQVMHRKCPATWANFESVPEHKLDFCYNKLETVGCGNGTLNYQRVSIRCISIECGTVGVSCYLMVSSDSNPL